MTDTENRRITMGIRKRESGDLYSPALVVTAAPSSLWERTETRIIDITGPKANAANAALAIRDALNDALGEQVHIAPGVLQAAGVGDEKSEQGADRAAIKHNDPDVQEDLERIAALRDEEDQ